jgi:hypothetical protein
MAIYYVWSGAVGSNNGSSWANAFTTLTAAFVTEVAGDTLYVAHDHAETSASAVTLTSSGTIAAPTKVVCVDRAGSVPPVAADRRTTASTATTGAATGMTISGFTHYDGIIFSNSITGIQAGFILPGSSSTVLRFDNCSLRFAGGAGTSTMNVGNLGGASGTQVIFNNTTLSFSAVGQSVQVSGGLRWRDTPSALIGSAVPTSLLNGVAGRGADIESIGVDFSAAGSGKTLFNPTAVTTGSRIRFTDCKLNAAVTKAGTIGATADNQLEIDFIRSGAGAVNYTVYRQRISGALDHETTIVRTSGASDGTTPIAWKIVTTNSSYSSPFDCPLIAIWNDTVGSAVTATVEGIWGGGAVPLDDECWLQVEYLGDASSPQGSFVNDGKANLLATATSQTASSVSWGGSTTKFKLNVTFTPQQKGWIYALVKCAKASSTFYIDPLVTLT